MNERRQDFELLQSFARQGEQQAFADVVRRHLDLVFATAVRKVEDGSAAEEVAQNVFAALARKAWQFAPDDSLPAWLHKTALLESKSWLRGELRRRRREQTAVELGTTMKTPDEQPALRALVPLLDEALLSLRERDRTALLLRFYESHSLRDVGAAFGVSEDTAQKRVQGALEKLAEFFKRRGFKTATVAATAAALQHTAASASTTLASAVVSATLQAAPPALVGLGVVLARLACLSKVQTAAVCLALAAMPVAWQWNETRTVEKRTVALRLEVDTARAQQEQLSSEFERLRAESGRLDGELIKAEEMQARDAGTARKLEELKQRIRGLLTAADYHWSNDVPYVRIPKSVVKNLEIQAIFGSSGTIRDSALELFGITPEEKIPTEQALGNYWNGVKNMMAAQAYETNAPSQTSGRLTKTVIVPPLGQELKTLAADTRDLITQNMGEEREKMIFGGWDEGAIQIFWPGNLWKISEEPQKFMVWVDSAATDKNESRYGASWSSSLGSTSGSGASALGSLPEPISSRFFKPWLQQFGITTATPPSGP